MPNNLKRLSNKVCLITGAVRGIGLNIARAIACEGGHLALADIDAILLNQVKDEFLAKGLKVEIFLVDLSKSDGPTQLVKQIISKFGKLDVVINNARAGKRSSFENESYENWDLAFDVNLKAVFFLAQAATPFMPDGGSIVTIGSISGLLVSQESPSYQISKAGLLHLNRYLATYIGNRGIRVNLILPGFIVQDEHRARYEGPEIEQQKYRKIVESLHPLANSPGFSDDVANAVIFLASKEAKFITGQSIIVDGGLSIQDPTKTLFSYKVNDFGA